MFQHSLTQIPIPHAILADDHLLCLKEMEDMLLDYIRDCGAVSISRIKINGLGDRMAQFCERSGSRENPFHVTGNPEEFPVT